MASPVVEQVVESASPTTAATAHTCTLPTATAGQLLIIIADKGSTAATVTDTDGVGLTELLDENSANGLYIAYKLMDGTEPASCTLTTSASTRFVEIAYRISGAANPATQAPEINGTTASGSSATPNPPASATPGSSKDYLFIAFAGIAGEELDDDTWGNSSPTNYTPSPPRQKTCGTAGANLGGLILSAERALTTGSAEDPDTFGMDLSANWRSQTIMVHPVVIDDGETQAAVQDAYPQVVNDAQFDWTPFDYEALDPAASVFVQGFAQTDEEFQAAAQNTDPFSGATFDWQPFDYEALSAPHTTDDVSWLDIFVPPVVYTDEERQAQNQQTDPFAGATFDWLPFDYEAAQASATSAAMGVEGSLARNYTGTETFEEISPGNDFVGETGFSQVSVDSGSRVSADRDVVVGSASYRASTVSATGNAFFRAFNNAGQFATATPQNRIFVRFNMRPSRIPASGITIFQWMRGGVTTQGPVIKLKSSGVLAINDDTDANAANLTIPVSLTSMCRVEVTMERVSSTKWSASLALFLDPTSGVADDSVSVEGIIPTGSNPAKDLDFTQGPALGILVQGPDSWGDAGPHAIWFDDFAISTVSMPAPTGTTPAQGERPSLIASAHTFDQAQFNASFDWQPFYYDAGVDEMQATGVEGSLAVNYTSPSVGAFEAFTGTVGDGTNSIPAASVIFVTANGALPVYGNDRRIGSSSAALTVPDAWFSDLDLTASAPQNRWFERFYFAISGFNLSARKIILSSFNGGGVSTGLQGAVAISSDGANHIEILDANGNVAAASSVSLTPDNYYRIEILFERVNETDVRHTVRIYDDLGAAVGSFDEEATALISWVALANSTGPLVGRSANAAGGSKDATGWLTYWIDDYTATTVDWLGSSGNSEPAAIARASLIRNMHVGGEDLADLYDWEPAGDLTGDPTSHDIAWYLQTAAGVDGTALPDTVVGVGSVPAPTAIGDATAAPATVVGTGSVPAPTATGAATAAPATVVGTGTVPAPTATGTAVATPAAVVGVGSVPAPTAMGNATALPATVGGTGDVPAPTASGAATAQPATVVGTGSVPAPTATGTATAAPATTVGIGLVPDPTASGAAGTTDEMLQAAQQMPPQVAESFDWSLWYFEAEVTSASLDVTAQFFPSIAATASPATVVGTGTVPAAIAMGNATAAPAAVVGVGLVPAPTATGTATASPATVVGTGTVTQPTATGDSQDAVAVHLTGNEFASSLFEWSSFWFDADAGATASHDVTAQFFPTINATASPATVVGTGSVPPPTAMGNGTAAPSTTVGLGDVPAPAASGGSVGTATPGAVQGVATIPAPNATGNATALPSATAGVGDVPAPTVFVSNTALPSTVVGTGAVPPPTSTGTATASPAAVSGVGTVPSPSALGNATALPAAVVGTGSVPPAVATGTATALPATVVGTGSVPAPAASGTATTTPATVAGIGAVPDPTAVGTSSGTAAPAAVSGVATITTPTASGTAFTTPATVTSTGTVPTADGIGTASASSATVVGTGSVPPATARGAATALPSAIAATGSTPPVSALGAATAAPATTAATGSVPPPAASGGSVGTATPGAVQGVATIPTPTILLTATATPASVAAIGAVPAPTAIGGSAATASPATVAGIGSVPAPTAVGGTASTATPSTVAGVGSVPAPTAYGAFGAFPATVAGTAVITTPTGVGDAVARPVSIAAIGNVPPPSDVGQIRGEWRQSSGNGWGSSGGDEWPQTNGAEEWEVVT